MPKPKKPSEEKPEPGKNNDSQPLSPTEPEKIHEEQIKKLRTEIAALRKIANKTPQQERELAEKEQKLAELENEQSQTEPKKEWSATTKVASSLAIFIGGIVILIILVLLILSIKKGTQKSQ